MLTVNNTECHYAECHYTECRYAGCPEAYDKAVDDGHRQMLQLIT